MAEKKDISIDIYHRIYRMAAKKIPSEQIAFTLDLPINVIRSIVDQFFPSYTETDDNNKKVTLKEIKPDKQSYLDIYKLQRLRFSIIDLNGMVTDDHVTRLQEEFNKVQNSNSKMIAIRMLNVKSIDEAGLSIILSFFKDFTHKGRYTAILDPSKEIETFLIEQEVEKKIPVFGTEKAFEDSALKIKRQKKNP
jgi:anti-anti-sigma regulatory factor